MFDTMTFTKIVGGFCGALLVFLLGNWVAGAIYQSHDTAGKPAYSIAVADTASTAKKDTKAAEPDFKTVLASADVKKGEAVFRKCAACHRVDGKNAVGPHLNGVVGRKVASVDGFSYSDALKKLGGDWTPDRLNEWLTSPKTYAPGTKMGFAGLTSVNERADVVAYLETLK
ncbi:MAG: cytochrome c family protein [Paracoccaceae bacterium]|nr:cytochrome c family protein [Paracoccaceae bacterium]